MKKYRLLKDISHPCVTKKEGEVFTQHDGFTSYLSSCHKILFMPADVENNPEWFAEVQEPRWTDDDLIDFNVWGWSKGLDLSDKADWIKSWQRWKAARPK